MSKSTIFGEESFFDKTMISLIEFENNFIYNEMSTAIKRIMPQVIINREKLERWVRLCVRLENIEESELIEMATKKKITDLQSQLAITEKALELACKKVEERYTCSELAEGYGCNLNYFKIKAREMLENE